MSKKKLLEEVLPLDMIREVEKWPVLYSRACSDRVTPHFKSKAWLEVGQALIPDWDIYSQDEKDVKASELAKKWRNFRDTYRRQLEVDKKISEGHNIKRKEYVYFKYMSFLKPHMQVGEGATRSGRRRAPRPAPARPRAHYIDEDKHFALSLIPSLKRMTDDQKLSAKVRILQIIKELRRSGAASPDMDALATDVKLESECNTLELSSGEDYRDSD